MLGGIEYHRKSTFTRVPRMQSLPSSHAIHIQTMFLVECRQGVIKKMWREIFGSCFTHLGHHHACGVVVVDGVSLRLLLGNCKRFGQPVLCKIAWDKVFQALKAGCPEKIKDKRWMN